MTVYYDGLIKKHHVTPLLPQRSYISFALNHWFVICSIDTNQAKCSNSWRQSIWSIISYVWLRSLYKQSDICMYHSYYSDIIMGKMASNQWLLNCLLNHFCSGAVQRKLQSSASLAFVKAIHQWSMDSPHKGPATWKYFHLRTSSWHWRKPP